MVGGGRPSRATLAAGAAMMALAIAAVAQPRVALAQAALPLKRTFVAPLPAACGPRRASPTLSGVAPTKIEEARRLFAQGQEASTVGDQRAARDLFQQAAQINPADERVPYYLGRSLEELRQPREAAVQYCRYLSLAPTGFDAEDVRARLDRLSTGGGGNVTPAAATSAAGKRSAAATRFRAAVDLADRGKPTDAERGFDDVIRQLPNAAEAYYDRGVLRATRRDFGGAATDFERYVALRPDAEDAPAVRERLSLLRRAATSPGTAFMGGVVLPGFGQFYTGRPVLGLVVAGGVGGGIAYALARSSEERTTVYDAAYGGTYTETDTVQVRRHLGAGLAIAGGAALLGAIEGYTFAQRRRSEAARFADAGVVMGGRADAGFAFSIVPRSAPSAADGSPRLAIALAGRLTF